MNDVTIANSRRGEAMIVVGGKARVLRPTFNALVGAEEELGPLFALVERAGEGRLGLQDLATLFWHCIADRGSLTREQVGEAVLEMGLAGSAKPLGMVLRQILQGGG